MKCVAIAGYYRESYSKGLNGFLKYLIEGNFSVVVRPSSIEQKTYSLYKRKCKK